MTDQALIDWLLRVITPLVEDGSALEVRQIGSAGSTVLIAIAAAEPDVGRLVGARGCVIAALRTLASAYGSRLDAPQAQASPSRWGS